MSEILKKRISIVGIFFSIILLIFSINKIELYSDDFYYKLFLKDGFTNFIKLNIEHYKNVNGRVLVHLLNEIMLNLNIYVYIGFIILCLILDFYCISKFLLIDTKYFSKENILYSICISFLIFLLIDVYVLKETIFWITGAFNYILPITISILCLSTIKKVLDENKINMFQLLLIFIASATTEQGFMATFLFTISYSIIHNLDKKIILNKKECIFLITELLGFLTIFLSPASRERASYTKTIFNTSLIELFEENFETLATRIIGEDSIFIIISFLIFSISMLTLKESKINKVLCSGFLISPLVVFVNIFHNFTEINVVIVVSIIILYIIISIIELFKIRSYRPLAIMLATAFLLQGGTFLLGEVSYRAMFILSLICVMCSANIFTILINLIKVKNNCFIPAGLVSILIIIGNVHILPIINGYSYNQSIFDDMRKSIEEYNNNGYVEINLNIDNKYAHTMGYLNGDFYDYFMDNYGISNIEENVHFVRDDASQIFIDGKRIKYPAIFDKDNVYVPARFVVNALGGNCLWTTANTKYFLNDYYVVIDNYSKKIIESSKKENINVDLTYNMKNYMNRAYINLSDLKYITGDVPLNIKVGLDI